MLEFVSFAFGTFEVVASQRNHVSNLLSDSIIIFSNKYTLSGFET